MVYRAIVRPTGYEAHRTAMPDKTSLILDDDGKCSMRRDGSAPNSTLPPIVIKQAGPQAQGPDSCGEFAKTVPIERVAPPRMQKYGTHRSRVAVSLRAVRYSSRR